MKYLFACIITIFLHNITTRGANPVDSLLTILDNEIIRSSEYEKIKTDRINLIREELRRTDLTFEDYYRINDRLYQEYEAYICDSARHYIDMNIDIARRIGNDNWLAESQIKKANILATSGLYPEAIALLNTVNKHALLAGELANYYTAFENTYLYWAEYAAGDEYMYHYLDLTNVYRDSTLMVVPENSYSYITTKVPRLIDGQQLDHAEQLLLSWLPHAAPGTRDYAVLTSILAFVYDCSGNTEMRKIYLIKSAISDIQASVKENNSLRSLAELLYEEGQTARADRYVKVSMEDANFFNARLRNIQASKMLPLIDKAYQLEKEAQRRELQVMLIIISVLSLFLMIAILFVIRQMQKLSRARRQVMEINEELRKLNTELIEANNRQQLTNKSLSEANHIKEEYIGRFLGLCSAYIDKLESYRRMLNKKAASGKVEDLYKTLKSTQFIEEELKDFYDNFDSAFLNIFPDFVDSFNKLLPAEEKIVPKPGERLTTELRIFALIRLGITDSPKIASFLRYSITTIYTYRSKLRNKSLYKERFEEEVMLIGSYDS